MSSTLALPLSSSLLSASRPGENLARFWALCGRRVVECDGIVWGRYKGPFFTSLPPSLMVERPSRHLGGILRQSGAIGVRFPSLTMPGLPSGTYYLRLDGYGVHKVTTKHRNKLKQGLAACEYRPVEKRELLHQGLELNLHTMGRQGREDGEFLHPASWRRVVDACYEAPGMMVRGAFVEGRLATYAISCREGACLHLMYKASHRELMRFHSNPAVDFCLAREAAAVPGLEWIENGAVSLLPNAGLDLYKRSMGYEVREHNLCIHFRPLARAVLVNSLSAWLGRRLAGHPRAAYAAKVLEAARLSQGSASR